MLRRMKHMFTLLCHTSSGAPGPVEGLPLPGPTFLKVDFFFLTASSSLFSIHWSLGSIPTCWSYFLVPRATGASYVASLKRLALTTVPSSGRVSGVPPSSPAAPSQFSLLAPLLHLLLKCSCLLSSVPRPGMITLYTQLEWYHLNAGDFSGRIFSMVLLYSFMSCEVRYWLLFTWNYHFNKGQSWNIEIVSPPG